MLQRGAMGLLLAAILTASGSLAPLRAQERTPEEIALERIKAARESGATELDLSGLGLTELPPEIGQLVNLQILFVRENNLTTLPWR